ncbi:hypothetical protein GOBAR_DD11389 [Gossypium barbadense]|nr:hypothetical protein GOBAR_DD11389 [Gossypium barbadense]
MCGNIISLANGSSPCPIALGVGCQLVLPLAEVSSDKCVLDEATFEGDVRRWYNNCPFCRGVGLKVTSTEVIEGSYGKVPSGHRFTTATFRRQTEPPSLNNHETLIVASPHRVERLDHLDLSTVA